MRKLLMILVFVLPGISHANLALDELRAIYEKRNNKISVENQQLEQIKHLKNNYQFVFIFRTNCPHCHRFAPILRDFADVFNIEVKAFSADGGQIKNFKSSPLSSDLYKTFFLTAGYKPMVPALYLMNKETLQAYPVLFGEATPYQLASRTWELMQHIKEQFDEPL